MRRPTSKIIRRRIRKQEAPYKLAKTQLTQLVKYERIETTLARAKKLRPLAERLITNAKRTKNVNFSGRVQAGRVNAMLDEGKMVTKVFKKFVPRYAKRHGGYTRIMRSRVRRGDNAVMAIIEFIDRDGELRKPKEPKTPPRRRDIGTHKKFRMFDLEITQHPRLHIIKSPITGKAVNFLVLSKQEQQLGPRPGRVEGKSHPPKRMQYIFKGEERKKFVEKYKYFWSLPYLWKMRNRKETTKRKHFTQRKFSLRFGNKELGLYIERRERSRQLSRMFIPRYKMTLREIMNYEKPETKPKLKGAAGRQQWREERARKEAAGVSPSTIKHSRSLREVKRRVASGRKPRRRRKFFKKKK